MRKLLALAAAATLATAGTASAAMSDDPGFSGNYRVYHELLNQYGQKIGYDVTYCDGTREIYVEPGNSFYNQGPPFEGDCWEPKPLPWER